MRPVLLAILLGALAATAAHAQTSPAPVKVVVDTLTWQLEVRRGPFDADYVALAESSVSPSDPYAVARDVDEGLIERVVAGERQRLTSYRIPAGELRALVRLRAETMAPDLLDLVLTDTGVIVVRSTTGNAGLFTGSTVWELGLLPTLDAVLDAADWPEPERTLLAAAIDALDGQGPP